MTKSLWENMDLKRELAAIGFTDYE